MTWGSTAPTAIGRIVTALQTALPTVDVDNGPIVSDDPALEGVSIGYQNADTPAVGGQFASEGYTSIPNREKYTVNCALTVRNGDSDNLAAQLRAFVLLGAVGAALAADHTLAELVLDAHVGEWELTQTQTNTGANARLLFGIDVDAYTTS